MISKIEILITLTIISCVFIANISLLLHAIIHFNNLDKELQSYIQRENSYEVQQLENIE